MDNSTTEFDEIENTAADKRRAQDFDDLQNELSGNNVGRIARFLSPEAHALLMEKRNGKQSAVMTALELALMKTPTMRKSIAMRWKVWPTMKLLPNGHWSSLK